MVKLIIKLISSSSLNKENHDLTLISIDFHNYMSWFSLSSLNLEYIFETIKTIIWPHFQTPPSLSKTLCYTSRFQLSFCYLKMWWNTLFLCSPKTLLKFLCSAPGTQFQLESLCMETDQSRYSQCQRKECHNLRITWVKILFEIYSLFLFIVKPS